MSVGNDFLIFDPGEVEGEAGPWVGVEVPVGDDWPDERLEGRQWHDGTWQGVRYFDIGGVADTWGDYPYGDPAPGSQSFHARRRRVELYV